MDLSGKQILVIGLARTGRECARFLAQRGARVRVTDRRTAADLKSEIESLEGLGVHYRLGGAVAGLA